jgi:sugar transferase EpsL
MANDGCAPHGLYARGLKRVFDLILGSTALVASLPLQAVTAAAVGKYLGTPVLYRQFRPGLNGEPFEIIKFRTMTDERDPDGELLPDDLRINRFGSFLRSTSLDELPELVNVVRGDMSLVGPRPLLMSYLDRYSAHQAKRHLVRPGVTGLAQVTGRNNQDWETKLDSDVVYVERLSFLFDLKILGRTVWKVLSRADISHRDHATTFEFGGTSVVATAELVHPPQSDSQRHPA